jgi:hypothetical protein
MKRKRGRPPKAEADKFTHYDFVRLTTSQYNKVSTLAKRLGNVSRAGVFRYLLDQSPAEGHDENRA